MQVLPKKKNKKKNGNTDVKGNLKIKFRKEFIINDDEDDVDCSFPSKRRKEKKKNFFLLFEDIKLNRVIKAENEYNKSRRYFQHTKISFIQIQTHIHTCIYIYVHI